MPPKREPTPLTSMPPPARRRGSPIVVPSASTNPSAMRAAIPLRQRVGLRLRGDRLVGDDERPAAERGRGVAARDADRGPARGRLGGRDDLLLLDRVPAADGDGVDLAHPGHAGPEVEQGLAPDELDRRVGGGRRRRGPEVQLARADIDLEAGLVGQAPEQLQVGLVALLDERDGARPTRSSRPSARCAARPPGRCRRSSSPGRCRCASCGAGPASGRTRARRGSPRSR